MSLPRPTTTVDDAQARHHAAGLAFDHESAVAKDDVEGILLAATCGVLAERIECVRTFVGDHAPESMPSVTDWPSMLRPTIFSGWTKVLIGDIDGDAHLSIVPLWAAKGEDESPYLDSAPEPRAVAWELVALYHLMGASRQATTTFPR
jgi:hypothetical protein